MCSFEENTKSHNYVLFQVVGLALRGTYQNCGQNCIGLERVVALKGIYDKLVSTMEQKVNALTQVRVVVARCVFAQY